MEALQAWPSLSRETPTEIEWQDLYNSWRRLEYLGRKPIGAGSWLISSDESLGRFNSYPSYTNRKCMEVGHLPADVLRNHVVSGGKRRQFIMEDVLIIFQCVRKKADYSRENLTAAVANSTSMSGVLRELGLKQGGGSQMSVAKRVEGLGIDISHFIRHESYVYSIESRQSINDRQRRRRLNPANRAWYVIEDARKSDKRYGREFGLTREYVDRAVSLPCSYCGDTSNLMTLDRKDNTLGHTDDNCSACCIRCNLIRGDMPYEAWLKLSAFLPEIRKSGLFGDWLHRGR
jgi:hypothetical protein